MFKKDYNKQKIIKLAVDYGNLKYEYDVTTLEKRLDDIIQFLNRSDVKELLEKRPEKKKPEEIIGDFFYTKVMNITEAKGGAYKSYDFNIIDAIFLAILISLYDNPFFKKIRSKEKAKTISTAEEDEWTSVLATKTKEFSGVWVTYKKEEEEKQSMTWEVVALNIESLLYTLTLTYRNKKAIENRQNIKKLIKEFGGLPEHLQVDFYEKNMKNRINRMQEYLNIYIEQLKVDDPEEYETYLVHKTLFEIDEKY